MLAATSGFTRTAKLAFLRRCAARAASKLHLAGAFDVEEQNAGSQRRVDLRGLLADAGEHNLADCLARGGLHPLQLTAGDNVEARA